MKNGSKGDDTQLDHGASGVLDHALTRSTRATGAAEHLNAIIQMRAILATDSTCLFTCPNAPGLKIRYGIFFALRERVLSCQREQILNRDSVCFLVLMARGGRRERGRFHRIERAQANAGIARERRHSADCSVPPRTTNGGPAGTITPSPPLGRFRLQNRKADPYRASNKPRW
jgi:hypothetical protein